MKFQLAITNIFKGKSFKIVRGKKMKNVKSTSETKRKTERNSKCKRKQKREIKGQQDKGGELDPHAERRRLETLRRQSSDPNLSFRAPLP